MFLDGLTRQVVPRIVGPRVRPDAQGRAVDDPRFYAEIDLEMKAKAVALCDAAEPGPDRPWKENKGLMAWPLPIAQPRHITLNGEGGLPRRVTVAPSRTRLSACRIQSPAASWVSVARAMPRPVGVFETLRANIQSWASGWLRHPHSGGADSYGPSGSNKASTRPLAVIPTSPSWIPRIATLPAWSTGSQSSRLRRFRRRLVPEPDRTPRSPDLRGLGGPFTRRINQYCFS